MSTGGSTSTDVAGSTSSAMGSSSAGGVTFRTVSECAEGSYTLVDGGSASVQFSGFAYAPRCLKVHVGASVTLPGNGTHPLRGAPDIDGVANPFPADSGATSNVTRTLSNEGFYGYYCERHGSPDGTGMAGAVWVVP